MTESQVNASTAGTDAAESAEVEQGGLERKMETRHLTMISLGGVIGTGLFLSSGYTIHQAGPLGAIIAYGIGSILVYFVMLSLGELSVAMPYAGSFHLYAKRFIGPGTAFTIAVLYWLNWAVALASEFTAAGLLMQRWFPDSPAWIWSAAFIAVVFMLNILSVRLYGESEFWFASIKVFAIIAFIVVGLLAMFGAIPIAGYDHAPLFENFYDDGWLPNGVIPIFSTLLTVVFAFSGTEVVGVAAGDEGSGAGDSEGRAYYGVASCDFLHRLDRGDVRADSVASVGCRCESVCARVPVDRHAVCRRCDEFRGVDGGAVRCEFRLVCVLAYGLVACAGGYDSARARQDEFSWCARVRGALQYGRIVVSVAVFCGCRFDGVLGVGCGFRLGHAGGVGVGFRLPLAFPQAVACSRPFG